MAAQQQASDKPDHGNGAGKKQDRTPGYSGRLPPAPPMAWQVTQPLEARR